MMKMKRVKQLFGVMLSALLIFICAIAMADVVIDKNNFPDDNFRNFLLNNYQHESSGGTAYFTDAQIQSITQISIMGKNISSLQGIKKFTALQMLFCPKNQIKTLDVSDCTALQNLYCSDNEIEELNISGCTALQSLNCYNNKLNKLNVSDCTELQELDCSSNLLSGLDVSNNQKLRLLDCHNN